MKMVLSGEGADEIFGGATAKLGKEAMQSWNDAATMAQFI